MAQLTIEVNGKPYVVGCEDGQEAHLRSLAAVINSKLAEVAPGAGQLGETRLMLLGALILADELGDAKAELADAQGRVHELEVDLTRADAKAAAALDAAAQKLEAMASG